VNDPGADLVEEVLSLCRALRDGKGMLALTEVQQGELLSHVAGAEQAATMPSDRRAMDVHVRAIRYLLIEVADGPVSAFMADAAARVLGDGYGRLFS
jgi:hypothetical protein